METTSTTSDHAISLRILVAEDSPVVRLLLQLLIENLGHLVDVVVDGVEAIHALNSKSYDVVILDIQMPRISGVEVARFLREEGTQNPFCWVVAISGSPASDLSLDTVSFDRFLAKPILLRDLELLISEVTTANPFSHTREGACASRP